MGAVPGPGFAAVPVPLPATRPLRQAVLRPHETLETLAAQGYAGHVVVEVANEAGDPHDLAIDGGHHTALLEPGETERLDLGEVTSDQGGRCTVGDHDIAGMTLAIEAT